MAKKIGVILSGCGFRDGAEIQESVLTLLAIDRAGAQAVCMAPDMDQATVVNHLTGEATKERRNVLVESARIARGAIRDVAGVKAEEIDALVLPGGFGAALNLSDFGGKGAKARVHPDVERLLRDVHARRKPIGAICIAPGVVAAVLGKEGVRLTVGNDADTARAIEGTGARHQDCPVEDVVVDVDHRIVSTPAYMLGPGIRQVAAGIEKAVAEVIRMA